MPEAIPDVGQWQRNGTGAQAQHDAADARRDQEDSAAGVHRRTARILAASSRMAAGARGLGRLNSEPLTRRKLWLRTAGTTCHSGRPANAEGPSDVAKNRSGFCAGTPPTPTTPGGAGASAKTFLPPAPPPSP